MKVMKNIYKDSPASGRSTSKAPRPTASSREESDGWSAFLALEMLFSVREGLWACCDFEGRHKHAEASMTKFQEGDILQTTPRLPGV